MANISFSPSAKEKILTDTNIHAELRGETQHPRLSYYFNCWSIDADGNRIDYGDGFHLSFPRDEGAQIEGYILVAVRDGLTVAVLPPDLRPDANYVIDYQDRSFTISKVP